MTVVAVRIVAKNDINGNPRRGWLIANTPEGFDYAKDRAFIDEGYDGDRLFRAAAHFFGLNYIPVVYTADVTPTEYRRLVKQYGGTVNFGQWEL